MPDRVTPLPGQHDRTVELTGDEAWLTTLDDRHDTTVAGTPDGSACSAASPEEPSRDGRSAAEPVSRSGQAAQAPAEGPW